MVTVTLYFSLLSQYNTGDSYCVISAESNDAYVALVYPGNAKHCIMPDSTLNFLRIPFSATVSHGNKEMLIAFIAGR